MNLKRKVRSTYEKLVQPDARWLKVTPYDVFSLPDLPPGLTEFLEFDHNILPPNCTEHKVIDEIWNEEINGSFVKDIGDNCDWSYGGDGLKHWTVSVGLSNFTIGLCLMIRADYSAKTSILQELGRKICQSTLAKTVKMARDLVVNKWPKYEHQIPGEDLIRRFIANCRFSPENEALLSKNLTSCVRSSSRRMSNDEKGAKFTGNADSLLNANKPENKVISWTADAAVETRHQESFAMHLKTHHAEPTGPQTIWNEYYKNWSDVYIKVGHDATCITTDGHYMCKEVLDKNLERGIKFISGFDSNKFKPLTSLLHLDANKAGECAAIYNAEHNLLVMKRTNHEGTTKFSISNYMVHSRGHAKQKDLSQWDAYNSAYYLCDRLHQQIMTKQHRRWPFRHGAGGHPGIQSHIFDILWCFIIEDVRVAYRELQHPDIERPTYAPFVLSLAFHMMEKGLKQLAEEARR